MAHSALSILIKNYSEGDSVPFSMSSLVHSRFSSMSHCGLILGLKEWNWRAGADLRVKKKKKKKQAKEGFIETSPNPCEEGATMK